MVQDDAAYLQHIRDAILRIQEYLEDIEETDFYKNHLVQGGVIRQLEIIGEATKRLSLSLREQYNNIPWTDIAGMRDKLIHNYLGVDLEQVWLTAKDDIPNLKTAVNEILKTRDF